MNEDQKSLSPLPQPLFREREREALKAESPKISSDLYNPSPSRGGGGWGWGQN